MKLKLLAISMLVIAGCSKTQEDAQLQETSKVDSLLQVVEEHRYAVALLSQVGMYMDSIDENRKMIAVDLETGLNEQDYIQRMKSLNEYTQKAEWTIAELEKTRGAYASQVKRLKKQVIEQGDQIAILQISVEDYKAKNANLEDEVKLTREQLLDTQVSLNYNENALEATEERVAELGEKLTLSEAETFYAKGEGMELMASRIEFAPKRKKLTLEQSLAFYQEAVKLGHVPAKARAQSIQKLLE
jgi:chromosome segregation ATPase